VFLSKTGAPVTSFIDNFRFVLVPKYAYIDTEDVLFIGQGRTAPVVSKSDASSPNTKRHGKDVHSPIEDPLDRDGAKSTTRIATKTTKMKIRNLAITLLACCGLPAATSMDYRYFVAGGTCAAISHGITTPIDVIKTKIQANPQKFNKGMKEATLTILKEDGPDALLGGLGPTVVGYGIEGTRRKKRECCVRDRCIIIQWLHKNLYFLTFI
jgi:hypothetical protein